VSAAAPTSRLERRRREVTAGRVASTPRRLRGLWMLIAGSAIALTAVGFVALVAAEATMIGVQQRDVPSILGMQRTHAWLADADRSAANAYLAGGSEVTLPELQFQADIAAASKELQAAGEHDPAGSDGSRRLQSISALVGQYVELIQTASVDDRLGLSVGTVYLQAGTSLMHRPDGILAQVDALRGVYSAGLDRARLNLRIIEAAAPVYAIVAVVLVVLLLHTQRFVTARFHRRRSPALLAAMLLVVVVAMATGAGAWRASQSVQTAGDQTYTRLQNLWKARALVYDANGSESLFLIARDATGRAAADRAFQAETHQIGALLADEQRTAATTEERNDTLRVLARWGTFLEVDAAVRAKTSLGASGEADAVALALGTDRGQLTFAFADVDWYLGLVIQSLQQDFDSTMTFAEQVIGVTVGIELLGLAVVALTFWGLRPRLAEYRGEGPRRPAAALASRAPRR
jgi:hypothetical protein